MTAHDVTIARLRAVIDRPYKEFNGYSFLDLLVEKELEAGIIRPTAFPRSVINTVLPFF